MSTPTTPDLTPLQQSLEDVVQAGAAGAAPFIHSKEGLAKETKVLTGVQTGIALLPTLGNLFHLIGSLFHHAHNSNSQSKS